VSKLRLAVVGVGLGGKTHIRSINRSADVLLDSVVAPNRELNQEVARDEGVPLFSSLSECLADRTVDGVVIASPNRFHFEHATHCIKSRIPLLLEKPITADIDEARKLCELADEFGTPVLIGHHRAHNPVLNAAVRAVAKGQLGRLVSFSGSAQFYKPKHYFEAGPWRKEIGGGPILINMIHEADVMRRLMGEVSRVFAIVSRSIRNFPVEDTATISLEFKNGALGAFVLSDVAATPRSWEQTSGENPSYPRYKDEDCYSISGTRGSLGLPSLILRRYPDGIDASWWTEFVEERVSSQVADSFDLQLKNFVAVVRGESKPVVTALDGYRNLLVVDAIRRSAEQGQPVKVNQD
jgi:predicted dehydrogenase